MKLKFVFLLVLLHSLITVKSQNVINNGDNIIVNAGAYFVITGDYINETANGDGKIDIDGNILLDGNWLNNASTPVFTNIETIPDGHVIFRGIQPQYIGGTNSTHFENISLLNSNKTLQVTNCEVNGILTLDAVLNLNKNKIILDNNQPAAINYVSKYMLSETNSIDGYGEVQWNIGTMLNTYRIPFGTGTTSTKNLELVLTTNTPGQPSTGNISFATYPSDCDNNPLPTGVISIEHDATSVADRFWNINPDFGISKPDIDIIFKYNDEDLDICNGKIVEENLKAMRYNTSQMTWNDITHSGIADKNAKTVTISGVSKNDFYAPWALVTESEMEIYVPNAFTPDNNGINDLFGPKGLNLDKYEYTMYIYDRWGEMIFKSDDVNKYWNGKPTGSDKFAPLGVYTWLITLKDSNANDKRYVGRVTLLK